MIIKRWSTLTKQVNAMDLDITPAQIDAWQNGALIQDAMPELTAEEREFLMTGMSIKEQDIYFDMNSWLNSPVSK